MDYHQGVLNAAMITFFNQERVAYHLVVLVILKIRKRKDVKNAIKLV